MKGPGPQPTKLRLLRGNPGKRAINKREPQPAILQEVPKPPSHLSTRGKAEWRRVAAQLIDLGLLSDLDLSALAAYCDAAAAYEQASNALKGQPLVIES